MANNNALFNAAYSGSIKGLSSRWLQLESIGAAGTAQAINAAAAFATMLDSLIAAGTPTAQEADLLYSLSEGVWDGRLALSNVPNDYSEIAASIAGIYTSAAPNLLPVAGGGGSGTPIKYSVGPAWTGAEFATVQAAVDQAVIDGHGATYGGVLFDIYPASYGAVVIPSSIRYWHMRGPDGGGPTGPFISSITYAAGASGIGISMAGIGCAGINITQAAGSFNTYAEFVNVWVFGSFTFNCPDVFLTVKDTHLYNSAAGGFTIDAQLVEIQDCITWADVAHTIVSARNIRLLNNSINGFVTETCIDLQAVGNAIASINPVLFVDNSSNTSLFADNTVDYLGAGTVSEVYDKTGASELSEGSNNWSENITTPILITAGTRTFRSIDVDKILIAENFTVRGVGPGSDFDAQDFENVNFSGVGTGAFQAPGHSNFIVPGSGTGVMVGSGYIHHQLGGTGVAGSEFYGGDHREVDFTEYGGLGELFLGDNFTDHSFLGTGGLGDFNASNHRSFIAVSAGGVNSRFDAINHLIVNFEGQNPLDPASAFIVDLYRNWTADFSGATRQEGAVEIDASSADILPLLLLSNILGTNGAAVEVYTGDRDPNTIITAPAGSVYIRDNGTIYVNQDNVTAWAVLTYNPVPEFVAGVTGATAIDFTTQSSLLNLALTGNATLAITYNGPGTYQITIDSSGSFSVTWPAMEWVGGVVPVQTDTGKDMYVIYYDGIVAVGQAAQNIS